MRRVNFTQQLQKYVIDSIINEELSLPETATDKEKLEAVYEQFLAEFWNNKFTKQQFYNNEQVGFCEYLKGLPSYMSIHFYDDDIERIGKEWGALAENANDGAVTRWINSWFMRISQTFFQLKQKHNV